MVDSLFLGVCVQFVTASVHNLRPTVGEFLMTVSSFTAVGYVLVLLHWPSLGFDGVSVVNPRYLCPQEESGLLTGGFRLLR